MRARRGMAGFTLMEMLVAITLLALLSLTVLLGMRIGFRAWEKAERHLEAEAQEAAVQEYLERALASTVAYKAVTSEEKLPPQFVPFQGTRQAMRWLSTYSTVWRERSGLVMVECILTGDGDARRLVVQQFPVRGDTNLARQMLADFRTDSETGQPVFVYRPFEASEEARTLVSPIRAARFEFLKVKQSERNWQETWDGGQERQIPAAVRLVIQTSAGERKWTVPIPSEVIGQ